MSIHSEIERVQSAYRRQIAESWKIEPGSRVLELGCGQGDMTVALAQRVGPTGRILAVDPASPDYGAPETLGQAIERIKQSPLGSRIDFLLNIDVLNGFERREEFDCVVLAHCSWYFSSNDQLLQTFAQAKSWAPKLCFAEWDLTPTDFSQTAHMLAVFIQGQVEAFKRDSVANVRTPSSMFQIERLLDQAGWEISRQEMLDTAGMQDAKWEIDACRKLARNDAAKLDLPAEFLSLLETQVSVMEVLAGHGGYRALPSYSLVAERSL